MYPGQQRQHPPQRKGSAVRTALITSAIVVPIGILVLGYLGSLMVRSSEVSDSANEAGSSFLRLGAATIQNPAAGVVLLVLGVGLSLGAGIISSRMTRK
jgi:hypothetical protein